MNPQPNGTLEDVCVAIGFGATMRLCAIYGGRSLYVPASVKEEHPLCKLLGKPAFNALSRAYGDETMSVPRCEEFERWKRVRQVSDLLSKAFTVSEIAKVLMLTPHQVRNLRKDAEDLSLIPMVVASRSVPRVGEQVDLVTADAGGRV